MKLTIINQYDTSFIRFLMREYVKPIMNVMYNPSKLERMRIYLNKEFGIKHTPSDIIKYASRNLVTHGYMGGKVDIEIDNIINYPGTNIKLIDLCKMINFGVLGMENINGENKISYIPGEPVFTTTFQYIESIIDEIYVVYESPY